MITIQEHDIFNTLNKLPKNKPIIVEWLDASTINNAVIKFPLPNYYVETLRRTTGTFLCLQKGKHLNRWHLVLELDTTSDLGSCIRSIPLCLVYKVML